MLLIFFNKKMKIDNLEKNIKHKDKAVNHSAIMVPAEAPRHSAQQLSA
jgi:hypothetical protein